MKLSDQSECLYIKLRKCGHFIFAMPVISLSIALATHGCKINLSRVEDLLVLAFCWFIVLPAQKFSERTARPDTLQENIAWFTACLRVYVVPYVLIYFFVRLAFASWQPAAGEKTLCDVLGR